MRETMLELATSASVRPRSSRIVTVSSGGKVYLHNVRWSLVSASWETVGTYHAQNASMKPSHEKKNTRP